MESIRRDAPVQDELTKICQWILNYRNHVDNFPVLSQAIPGQIMELLPNAAPKKGEDIDDLIEDLDRIILPGITHWQHPKFMGYFPANGSLASLYGELIAAGLGVQGMNWNTSPAATELELKVMDWLRKFWGLPDDFTGVIQDSASAATTVAMLAARERATGGRTNTFGYEGQKLIAYCSEEAHSSVEKAARILGIGANNLRKVPVDKYQAMNSEELMNAVVKDREKGFQPFFVTACFGTTATCGIDPFETISDIAKRFGMWMHVDAAYAGASLCLPEIRQLASGISEADSIVINPHKWLLTHFDCTAFFTRHPSAIKDSLTLTPEYLKTDEDEQGLNLRDWGLGLGRRFRALKIWAVLRLYGTDALSAMISNQITWANKFAAEIKAHPHFELLTEPRFNLVCFRYNPSSGYDKNQLNDLNRNLIKRLNLSGKAFLTHTVIDGSYAIRMVIGQTNVQWKDVAEVWDLIQSMAIQQLS